MRLAIIFLYLTTVAVVLWLLLWAGAIEYLLLAPGLVLGLVLSFIGRPQLGVDGRSGPK
jgi:hypothetical protein